MQPIKLFLTCVLIMPVCSLEWPAACKLGQYHDPGLISCLNCSSNASLVTAKDGFSCTCDDNSFQVSPTKCQSCSSTEVLSADGASCVPRRCQTDSTGRTACRKCPYDYISVTQSFDGSPLREVQCVKCTKGYKPQNNQCVRCESCACPKNHIAVLDKCVPKTFLVTRPKYEEKVLHPNALLDVVKHEHFCTVGDVRACRVLGNECVRNFYTTDRGGPCRLWLQPTSVPRPDGLPKLLVDPLTPDGKKAGEVQLISKIDRLLLVVASHTADGGMIFYDKITEHTPCLLPVSIKIGKDFTQDCNYNVTDLDKLDARATFVPYLKSNGDLQQLPVIIRKSNNRVVQRGEWSSNKFGRYFLMDTSLTSMANITTTVYLRNLIVNLRVQRDNTKSSHLNIEIFLEAQYASKSPLSKSVPITLKIENQLPGAGVLRGLEIWGGVLGALLALYAIVQWRGAIRRGGLHISLLPIMSGCIADALYFAVLFSTLHALAAEAGTLGLTLPLSKAEEHIITAFVYAALSLKIIKIAWINWKQCTCDIFFLDWSEYNPTLKESVILEKSSNWRVTMVAREWSSMQVKRRVSLGFTVTLTLLLLHVTSPWQADLPDSRGYTFVFLAVAWWCSYGLLLSARWILDKASSSPTAALPRVCVSAGVSLLVFQEEFYAHYVHGRNDDSPDARVLAGPLSNCRVVCAPQLRLVYKQLSSGHGSLGQVEAKRSLLTRFLAAFFERALDGMSWVASQRTLPERLLDLELSARETTSSALLYHPDDVEPSCFALTWWCEEWSLGTLDAMIFSCVVIAGGDAFLASLVTLIVWQISRFLRTVFSNRNLKIKMESNVLL